MDELTEFQKQFFFDDADYQRSCKGKNKYDNAWHAQFAIDECHEKHNVKLSYYLCKYCGKYHLTSEHN